MNPAIKTLLPGRTVRFPILVLLIFQLTCLHAEEQSRYLEQLNALSYPAAGPVTGAVSLHWDLSRGKQHSYEYREQGFNSRIIRGQPQENLELVSQQVDTKGSVLLQSTFDKKARLLLNQVINLETLLPDGSIETQSGLKGSYEIEDISPKGAITTHKPIDLHFQSLMRLPDNRIKPGETVTIPVGLTEDLQFGNITLTFAGNMDITLAGFTRCQDHVCAELHTRTEITEVALPEDTAGEVTVDYDAQGRSWFDLDDKKLVESMRITLMEIDAETPADDMESMSAKVPDTVHIVTRYDTLVHLKHTGSGRSLGKKPSIKKYRRNAQPE